MPAYPPEHHQPSSSLDYDFMPITAHVAFNTPFDTVVDTMPADVFTGFQPA